jgi:hypothetical protein
MKPADQIMLGEWFPLDDVFARVTKHLRSPVLARRVMYQALADGQATAMEWSLERGGSDSKKRELPTEFWHTAEFIIFDGEPDKLFVRSKELQRNSYHYSFYLRPSDVEKLWPTANQAAAAGNEALRPWPRKSPAGAKGKFDWEIILIEAAGHMYEKGVPKSLTELCDHIEHSFAGVTPGKTQLEIHLGPLYSRFSKVDGKF